MKRTFLLSFLVCAFLFSHQEPVSARSGEEIFEQGRCSRCHTLGRGRFVGPDLLGAGERYSKEELVMWARNPEAVYAEKKKKPVNDGYPPMPPMNLPEADARKVADYIIGYRLPSGLSRTGTIKGLVKNVTTGKPAARQDVALISYMGEKRQKRLFAKSDSQGRFSFPSLRWDRSYEITLFHGETRYVSGKMVFSPGEDEITVDLPVYDATDSDEKISLRSLNVIVYPDDGGEDVKVTSLYAFENSGNRVFTGKKTGEGPTTLVFSVPRDAEDVTFSDGTSEEDVVREGKKLYSRLPFLPGAKRVALGYSLPLSRIGREFQIDFDYGVENLAVFIRKTEREIKVESPRADAQEIMIHDEAFLKYEKPELGPGSVVFSVSGSSFLAGIPLKYAPVVFFFVLAAAAAGYFLYGRKRFPDD